ncbi:alpha/beta fold hydrolase [Streptomyces sp. NBC_01006]|uniref:alpha/beta fold hydrolase n=1 Tax=Streptomyces sp. NBC_01006 TaxID=2903716 RepID=UPI003864AA9C|nr:alpha/beta hydrolase [Streptomyces sp. NBC_01006]
MQYGPDDPDATYVKHGYPETTFDTGEVRLNHATTGSADEPALPLIPAQAESWWGYEAAMRPLEGDFEVFAVDLRGQGRSTRTPGRYTLDNMGNDLVRFISGRIRRPVVVSGLSSGGVIAAWLSAYAPPRMLRGTFGEDPPLFSSQIQTPYGPSMNQGDEPSQTWKEYDPEWARAFAGGSATASCDHTRMLAAVKVPVMLTHHFRKVDEETGRLQGTISDLQVHHVRELIIRAGQRFDYKSFPQTGHAMHQSGPQLYAATLRDWISSLDARAGSGGSPR